MVRKDRKGTAEMEWLIFIGVLVLWIVIQGIVLPKMGIST